MKTWKEVAINLARENDKLREAIAAWPVATHNSGCAPMQDGGPCYCGTFKLNRARAEARKLAGLEGTNANV